MLTCFSTMKRSLSVALLVCSILLAGSLVAQEVQLELDPAATGAEITLGGNFHKVEGSFAFKHGTIHYQPATGAASGEVVFDATSGKTGNSMRDRKMHKDVIESQIYPEITFRPVRAEGTLAPAGDSTLQVHGMFAIHGAEHEITIPVRLNVRGDKWTAKASFTVPYANWGMKNPSKLFLRVDNDVKVQFRAIGSLAR